MDTQLYNNQFQINVRIMPQGMEVELDLPALATGEMIVEGLINNPSFNLARIDPTTQRAYDLSLIHI